MRTLSMSILLAALLSGCSTQTPNTQTPNHVPEEPLPSGPPVQTGPPNVPEFTPAFPGQTRAPAIQTQTAFQVTEVATGFKKPWAIAFLPDQRMLVTEKPTGELYIVTPQGEKSPAVAGLPRGGRPWTGGAARRGAWPRLRPEPAHLLELLRAA